MQDSSTQPDPAKITAELSALDRYHRYRALDGCTVLLCSNGGQINAICRGQLVDVTDDPEPFGITEITIEFPKPLGRILFSVGLLPLPGDEPVAFTLALPMAWRPCPRRAKWYLAEVYLEIVAESVPQKCQVCGVAIDDSTAHYPRTGRVRCAACVPVEAQG